MTTGFVRKKYNTLYLSSLISWIIYQVGTLADSILGGIFISENAVSATGLVQPIFSLVVFLSSLFGVGCAIKFSNYIGAFAKEKAYQSAGIGILFSAGAGLVIALTASFFRDSFFSFYDVSPEVLSMAKAYYDIFVFKLVFYPVYYTIFQLVLVDGGYLDTLLAILIQTFFNTLLSILLVQKMGVRGLALGSSFSTLLAALSLLPHFFQKSNAIHFSFRFDFKLFREIIVSGSTMSLTTLYIAIVSIFMNKFVIDRFGDVFLPVYTVVNTVLCLGEISTCATDSAISFIGVSYGERNYHGLRSILDICTKQSVWTTLCMTLFFFSAAKYIPMVYGITTPEVAEASVYLIRILSFSFIAMGFVYEWINYLPEIERHILGNLVGFTYMLGARILFPTVFTLFWGFRGFVWGFFFTPFVAVAVASFYIIKVYGKKAFPYAIEADSNTTFSHEFAVNTTEIPILLETLRGEMLDYGLSASLATRIELVLEETLMIVAEKNTKKKVLAECTLIISPEAVKLITWDNGVIFNILDEVEGSASMRHYVAARLIANSNASAYLTTISFNRNSFQWKR